jgi:hypothetical protein
MPLLFSLSLQPIPALSPKRREALLTRLYGKDYQEDLDDDPLNDILAEMFLDVLNAYYENPSHNLSHLSSLLNQFVVTNVSELQKSDMEESFDQLDIILFCNNVMRALRELSIPLILTPVLAQHLFKLESELRTLAVKTIQRVPVSLHPAINILKNMSLYSLQHYPMHFVSSLALFVPLLSQKFQFDYLKGSHVDERLAYSDFDNYIQQMHQHYTACLLETGLVEAEIEMLLKTHTETLKRQVADPVMQHYAAQLNRFPDYMDCQRHYTKLMEQSADAVKNQAQAPAPTNHAPVRTVFYRGPVYYVQPSVAPVVVQPVYGLPNNLRF